MAKRINFIRISEQNIIGIIIVIAFLSIAYLGNTLINYEKYQNDEKQIECYVYGKKVFATREDCQELSRKYTIINNDDVILMPTTKSPVLSRNIYPTTQPTTLPTATKVDQTEYINKANDIIRRIDVLHDKWLEMIAQSTSAKNSCSSDSCKSTNDAIIKSSENFIEQGNKDKDWLRKIINFINNGGILDDQSKDAINQRYNFYN